MIRSKLLKKTLNFLSKKYSLENITDIEIEQIIHQIKIYLVQNLR